LEFESLEQVTAPTIGIGKPLLWFALIKPSSNSENGSCSSAALLMIIHHAIYDRWSASLVMKRVESLYRNEVPNTKLVSYSRFIQYLVQEVDEKRGREFWTGYLADCGAPQFPTLPSPKYQPITNMTSRRDLQGIKWPKNFTPATTLKAAWAILISQYCNSRDVVFGSIVMGRQAPLAEIEMIVGPTIATVPIRVMIDWKSSTISALLQDIHSAGIEMIPFEHYGLGRVQRLSSDTRQACQFQSLLVIQPQDKEESENDFLFLQRSDDDIKGHTYALVLECGLGGSSPVSSTEAATLSLSFDDQVVDGPQAEQILLQLEHIVRQLCNHGDRMETMLLSELDMLPQQDWQQIYAWNAIPPETIDSRIDKLIADRVSEQPNSLAINGHDGRLTYGELFAKARQLAYWLVMEKGVGPEIPVLLCCSKSVWTPVTILAVIMAGGVVVLVDPFQAVERLQSIASKVDAQLVLASATTKGVAKGITSSGVHIVDDTFIQGLKDPYTVGDTSWIPAVSGNNALYVIFTSGSTGTPKGVIITHANACSAVVHQKQYWGYDNTTRVFDLSSYSFDFVWVPFLHGLCAGACICIPSEDDRRNNLAGAIRELNVNCLNITPSLARTLDTESFPNIKKVILGGEALRLADATRWGEKVKVINAYGPSECTIASTLAVYGVDFTSTVNIGQAHGLKAWITSCNQPNKLAPIGAIGELVLEGPLVGRGYLDDVEETARKFISNPEWLSGIDRDLNAHGQRGRFYRTGDLVNWNSHGKLVFAGRADTQVKIRGQRVELEDIEVIVGQSLGPSFMVVADVIEISTSEDYGYSSQRLTVVLSSRNRKEDSDVATAEWQRFTNAMREDLHRHLMRSLPSYMVPSSILELDHIPLMSSGKVDRKRLRELVAQVKLRESDQTGPVEEPKTTYEIALRDLWSSLLGIAKDQIGRQENFFDLGGDSLMAIRLVGAARQQDLPLSVGLIFQHPRLDQMAAQLSIPSRSKGAQHFDPSGTEHCSRSIESQRQPLPGKSQVAGLLSIPEDMICDVLPVTEFQRYAIRSAFTQPRTEWNYFSMRFSGLADTTKLVNLCHQLVSSLEILRCVFLSHDYDGQYIQVVLRALEPKVLVIRDLNESVDEACARVCLDELKEQVIPGSPFVKFFILQSPRQAMCQLVIGISHALYDGISLPQMADYIGALYDGRPVPVVSQFSSYLNAITSATSNVSRAASYAHWRSLLQDAPVPTRITSDDSRLTPGKRMRMCREIRLSHPPKGVTTATVFNAAWGAAVARVTGQRDIVFGRAVSGRTLTSAIADHESVIGPCLNLVPVRMKFSDFDPASLTTADKSKIIGSLQSQLIDSIPHETMGLSEIVRQCTDWPENITAFGSVFYFQNIAKQPSVLVADQEVAFGTLPLDRPDPPEPVRLNVLPQEENQYTVELLVPEQMTSSFIVWSQLLDAMVEWLYALPEGNSHLVK
jgi:amino acid adenylation domain-containing protein